MVELKSRASGLEPRVGGWSIVYQERTTLHYCIKLQSMTLIMKLEA